MHLGLDPSTVSTGWAVIGDQGELVGYGVIKVDEDLLEIEKIAMQRQTFIDIIRGYNVKTMTCEDQFFGNNPDTLKKLVRVSTSAMIAAIDSNIPMRMCLPAQWRKVTHGNGKLGKPYTRKWANETYNKKFLAKENDITDAIGIAYCGYVMKTEEESA